jgi:hypothetical protein
LCGALAAPEIASLLSAVSCILGPEYSSHQNGMDKCNRKEKLKTFIVYNLDSKMPVAVGEQVSAETARYCASEITGTFHANLFAEEIDLEKKLRCYTRIGRLFLKSWR